MTRTIAIDFDGTLCTNEFPDIGQPYWGVINAAIKERQDGSQLILWTCREGELLDAAVKACEEWGLTFDAINDSTPEWKEIFGGNPRKVGATEYWDDRAVAVYRGVPDASTVFMDMVDENVRLIEENIQLTNERWKLAEQNRKATERINVLATRDYEVPCEICVHRKPCFDEGCEHYEEFPDGLGNEEYPPSCVDYEFGKCQVLEGTPCDGCDFCHNFEWNGE